MKKTYIVLSTIALLALGACESMDLGQEVRTSLSEEQVMKRYEYTMQHGLRAYNFLKPGFLQLDGAMSASVSDEAEHTLETSDVQKFNNGSWNPLDNPDNSWANYFSGIRNVNKFLSMSDSVDLDYLRLDPNAQQQALYKTYRTELKNAKYENRFLRAWFYFELVKRYGGVPIITEVLSLDDDLQSIDRNSLQECINFIVSECDSAAKNLPKKPTSNANLGKITQGAAMALKSRALLYAASDLYNDASWTGSYSKKELVSLSGDRTARWRAAADAAKALIDSSAAMGYSLATNYRSLFLTYQSPEIIFTHRSGATNSFEKASYPIGFDKGNSGTTPSQNLVDDYEVVSGGVAVPFNWNDTAHTNHIYQNRDPRLAMSVIVNNSAFKGRNVEMWQGGKDGAGVPLASKTGYYLKKYVDENLDLLQEKTSVHSWIYIRLAEIYLNYAEALNECDPGNADIKVYVDRVRQRTGVAMPVLADGLNQDEMRNRIRHERRIELAFEGHREWDLRRWMMAETVLGSPLKGVSITQAEGKFNYASVNVENRVFVKKMYFYPIPQSELNIQTNWDQNPLW